MKLTKDPSSTLDWRINSLLLALEKNGSIPPQLYWRLHSSSGSTPLIYGLPKIYEPEVYDQSYLLSLPPPTCIISMYSVTLGGKLYLQCKKFLPFCFIYAHATSLLMKYWCHLTSPLHAFQSSYTCSYQSCQILLGSALQSLRMYKVLGGWDY